MSENHPSHNFVVVGKGKVVHAALIHTSGTTAPATVCNRVWDTFTETMGDGVTCRSCLKVLDSLAGAPQPENDHATGSTLRAKGELSLAPLGSLCQGNTPFSGSSFRCAGRDGLASVAVHTWAPEGHEGRDYCGYHSPFDLTAEDRIHLSKSEAIFAEIDAAHQPAPRDLPTEAEVFGNLPRRSRKPKVGDLVRFDGKLCLVRAVGSKWLRLADMGPFATHLPRKIDRALVTIA